MITKASIVKPLEMVNQPVKMKCFHSTKSFLASSKIRQRYPLFKAHRLDNIFEYFELVQSKQVY